MKINARLKLSTVPQSLAALFFACTVLLVLGPTAVVGAEAGTQSETQAKPPAKPPAANTPVAEANDDQPDDSQPGDSQPGDSPQDDSPQDDSQAAAPTESNEAESDTPEAESDGSSEDESQAEDKLQAGHSAHGEAFNEGPRQAAYLMPGTGNVSFPVKSEHPDVQAFINQGVGQLHGFWYFEAERTFRQAAALDPKCAAAYWGMAMANSNNKDRAKGFIKEAMDRKDNANDRVRRYIEALDRLLSAKDAKKASDKYVDDLEKVVYDYPDDIEAKAFIAVHLWEGRRTGHKIRSHLAVDALIAQVLSVQPAHPVHHYRIHLWDHEKPERALEAAANCGQSAPNIAHMWHMPGHIYSRLKRYPDAVWQQEASARTDHAQMMRDGLLPDQIHNFAHNNEWLIRNLIHIGRLDDGLDLARNMTELPRHPKYNVLSKGGCSSDYGRKRLLQVLDVGEQWSDLLAFANAGVLEKGESISQQVEWLRAVGRAHHRLGHFEQRDEIAEQLVELRCRQTSERQWKRNKAKAEALAKKKKKDEVAKAIKDAGRRVDGDIRRIERGLQELHGYAALQSGDLKEAIRLLDKAGGMSTGYMAQLHLRNGDADKALKLVEKYAKSHENEVIPLANLAYIQWLKGDMDEAGKTMETLRKQSAHLDLQAAPFARLAPIAASLEWPRDWRTEVVLSTDVGQRPELSMLGPFRWQPSVAPSWSLTDANQETVSSQQFAGKPVVVIFYLGYGCLHCAEQLHEFAPRAAEFREAGIEVVAISTDDAEGLGKSLEAFEGEIPFPLLANDKLDVFRSYRVFDDFEDQPLHGTFLIDAEGRIRWHDISYEPFMDPNFVLDEAKRVLKQ